MNIDEIIINYSDLLVQANVLSKLMMKNEMVEENSNPNHNRNININAMYFKN